jgi:anti-sigma factor RsiW
MMERIDEQQIVRFLLGELSEDHRLELEEQIFKDDGCYRQVLAIEEELADDYVQNSLSASQRSRFEQKLLGSRKKRDRVEFAAALSRALIALETPDVTAPARVSWWNSLQSFVRPRSVRVAFATSFAALALLVGAVGLVIENHRLSDRVEQARREQDSSIDRTRSNQTDELIKQRELEAEIANLRTQGGEMQTKLIQKQRELETLRKSLQQRAETAPSAFATFVLSPGLTRGTDEPEKLIIHSSTRLVKIQLALEKEEDYQGYLAEIRTARGNLISSKSDLSAHRTTSGPAVSLTIPAKFLSTGEYEVALKGAAQGKLEAVGYYYFIALKR